MRHLPTTPAAELSHEAYGIVKFEYRLDGSDDPVLIGFSPCRNFDDEKILMVWPRTGLTLNSLSCRNDFFARDEAREIWNGLIAAGFEVTKKVDA